MGYEQQKRFLDFFESLDVTYVNFAALCPSRGEGRKPMKGEDRARTRDETIKSLGWAWHENKNGGEVYIRPARWLPDGEPGRWPVVFLDDLTRDAARALAEQYKALVVETSPGLHHVWLAVSRALSEQERKALQTKLAEQYGGDRGSISGEHFGRMPGYKNNKRGGCWVNIVNCGNGGRLYPVPGELEAEVEIPSPRGEAPGAAACASAEPQSLYASLGGWSSESERDFGWAIGRLRWAKSQSLDLDKEIVFVSEQLTARALARGKRKTEKEARRYAQLTRDAALARLR
jgi:hypothetical protein